MKILNLVVPVYQGEHFLPDLVQSFASQEVMEGLDFKLTIINDGSLDNSFQVAKELAEKHRNIEILTQKHQGRVVAYNHAISKSTADYFGLFGCDDVFSSKDSLIQRTLPLFQDDQCDLSFHPMIDVDENLKPLGTVSYPAFRRSLRGGGLDTAEVIEKCWILGGSMTFSKAIAQKCFPLPTSLFYADWPMLFQLSLYARKTVYIDTPLALYRRHSSNDSGRQTNCTEHWRKMTLGSIPTYEYFHTQLENKASELVTQLGRSSYDIEKWQRKIKNRLEIFWAIQETRPLRCLAALIRSEGFTFSYAMLVFALPHRIRPGVVWLYRGISSLFGFFGVGLRGKKPSKSN